MPKVKFQNTGAEVEVEDGAVLPEVTKNNGDRIISKHKNDDFSERKTKQKVIDPEKLKILQEATQIAEEWVVLERLRHVLDKMPADTNIQHTGQVIKAMIADVYREAKGEIVESPEASKAIGKKTALMFKQYLKDKMAENND